MSFQERKIAKIESKVTIKHELESQFSKLQNFGFTKLLNQSAVVDDKSVIEEKLRGNFEIRIREDLPANLRIEQLAYEPVAFHLHKRRDFLPRLEGKVPP